MVATQTEDGAYSIFELLGSYDVEVGDVVSSSDFGSMGGIEQAKRQVFLA